ncbi:MAG: hypothetical protein IJI11_00250 [Mogibacterium sp.]|nr:hypothetical protein [Mogibacterium sp.]
MKKYISILLALMLVLAFSGCEPKNSGDDVPADDGQNPVMNFVGNYVCDRASIFISAEGEDGASAIVTWASSASENSSWMMSGTFDTETLRFDYTNGVRTDYVYNDQGEEDSVTETYTDGTGYMQFTDGENLTLEWHDDKENIADGMVFEYSSEMPTAGMINPWQTADTLAAAAEGAGLDGFDIAEGSQISLGEIKAEEYRYMDGLAEAHIPVAAVEMTIRKGTAMAAGPEGDVSGDYNEYKFNWTQNIKGLEVQCYGNREGEATKTIWTSGDYCYAILAYGAGGDDDFGLSADDLNSLINGIQ